MKKIGLALGGGGAKGLAHIPLLGVFEELGLRPHGIAGTSIGAVIGSIYASGAQSGQIRELVERMVISRGDTWRDLLRKKEAFQWVRFLDVDFRGQGVFKGDRFIDFLYEAIGVESFEALAIPLRIVATDFWTSQQVVFQSGPLLSAIKASMGLPGLFTPVQRDGRTLIDGGGVNPVPHDILNDCDVVVAIDVMGRAVCEDPAGPPHPIRAVLETFDIMQRSIIAAKRQLQPPDIYIAPDITGIDMLDFHRADEIYRQAEPACRELRQALEKVM